MDLDGTWVYDVDPTPPFAYSQHLNGSGDMYPEIFVGRIDPYNIGIANEVQRMKDYFDRNHAYRTGSIITYNRSLLFVESDWEAYSEEWKSDVERLYSDVTLINSTQGGGTDAINYLNVITGNYDFCHSLIHSDQLKHYHDFYTSPTYTNYTNIRDLETTPLFWNLYCCYACDFNYTNNIK